MSSDLRDRVQHILRAEVAPAVGLDADDVDVLAVENGVATVRLGPGCASCGGGIGAIVAMLEQELRLRVPEVEVIEPVV